MTGVWCFKSMKKVIKVKFVNVVSSMYVHVCKMYNVHAIVSFKDNKVY